MGLVEERSTCHLPLLILKLVLSLLEAPYLVLGLQANFYFPCLNIVWAKVVTDVTSAVSYMWNCPAVLFPSSQLLLLTFAIFLLPFLQ